MVVQGHSGILHALANALVAFGIVGEQVDTRKQLDATQKHLEDMRSMAIKAFDHLIKASTPKSEE